MIEVETMLDKSNIPPGNKVIGLICHVKENNTKWEWDGTSWVDITPKTDVVDLEEIRDAIVTLDANKADKTELLEKSDINHEHTEYALIDHTHTGEDGTLISREEFSRHIANLDETDEPAIQGIHFINQEEKIDAFIEATTERFGRVKVGNTLVVNEETGKLEVRTDMYELGEELRVIEEEDLNREFFPTNSPFIKTTLQVFVNGVRISEELVEETEENSHGRMEGFILKNAKLNIGDRLIAFYFKGSALAMGNHAHSHLPNGEDPISFASLTNGGGLMSSDHLKQLNDNTENKLDISETTRVPEPNKILYLDENGYLPTSITGNSATTDRLKNPVNLGGWVEDNGSVVNGFTFDGTKGATADEMNVARKIHYHKSSDTTAMTGYVKNSDTTQIKIEPTDSLNIAIGKLERALDFKNNLGHSHESSDVVSMGGYDKASVNLTTNIVTPTESNFTVAMERDTITTEDSLNTVVAKLDVAADLNKQMAEHALRLGKLYTDDRFKTLLDGVDLDFDTLKELAAAIGNDKDFHKTVQDKLDLKADIESPTLTGIPKSPTAPSTTNTDQIATTAFVHSVGQGKVDTHKVVVADEITLGHIKSGGDIEVDADGVVSVKDNSHNHEWDNITQKPISDVNDIDDAVSLRHHHANKDILDKTNAFFTQLEKEKLSNIEDFANKYVLPPATTTDLGGVIIGTGLTINTNTGLLSVTDYEESEKVYARCFEEEFVATQNQTEFGLREGLYIRNCGQVEVFVNGAKVPMKHITENYYGDTVTLPYGLSDGDRVLIRYTQLSNLVAESHAHTHIMGGADEIPDATPSSKGMMSVVDKIKLDSISLNATSVEESSTNGNILIDGVETVVYTHPDATSEGHVTQEEKDVWNDKETPIGAQEKADKALEDAKDCLEPKFDKNTAFNKDFGNEEGTVSEGNHNHDGVYLKEVDSHTHENKHLLDSISAERMEAWDMGGSGGSGILVSATPPTSPVLNMLWVDLN